jgi:integrase
MDYLFVERKVGNATYNNNIKMGRALFNWAIERCYTKQNAFEKIKPKKKETKKRIIIPKDVRQKITNHLHDSGNIGMEIAVNLIYSSLIRPNEIRQLKISNVFLDEKYIIVPSEVAKNHNQRTSAMTDHTIELIRKMIAGKKYSKDFYLLGGDLLPAANQAGSARLRHEWDKITKELKIPKTMQLYSFRDTGIFEMLKSGIDNLTVMQHADHSSLDITTRYANHFDAALVDKINKLVPDF